MHNGVAQLPEGTTGVPQDASNVFRILQDLSYAPIGFNSAEHPTDHLPVPADVSRNSANSTADNIKEQVLASEENISLTSAQWSTVKDSLTVVHYMNDYTALTLPMFDEARVAWIRQFGWAPSRAEMMDAKLRAHEYRAQSGRHITALGTKQWTIARKEAYDLRGEAAVWTDIVAGEEVAEQVNQNQVEHQNESSAVNGENGAEESLPPKTGMSGSTKTTASSTSTTQHIPSTKRHRSSSLPAELVPEVKKIRFAELGGIPKKTARGFQG
jgi:hypothetical protein